MLVTIRGVYKWARKRRDYEGDNPTLGIDREEVGERDRVLRMAELRAVWQASVGLGDYGAILRILMLTGQRRAEIGSLTWWEIVEGHTGWQIELPKERVKNRLAHIIPMSALVRAQLPERRPGYPNLFGSRKVWGSTAGAWAAS